MKRFWMILVCAVLWGCGDTYTAPTATPGEGFELEEGVTQTEALVRNARWKLTFGNGSIQGDNMHVQPFSNSGSSAPTGQHFFVNRSGPITSGYPTGQVTLSGYNPPGSTYSAGLAHFALTPTTSITYQAEPGSGIIATVEWLTPDVMELTFQGDNLQGVYDNGEGVTDLGPFKFGALMSTKEEQPALPQEPLPFDPYDDIADGESCPAWVFTENSTGDQKNPNSPFADRLEKMELGGDEVRTGWDSLKFNIVFTVNLESDETYGGLITLDEEPVEGVLGTYPARVFMLSRDDDRRWSPVSPGSQIDLDITAWRHGVFTAEFSTTTLDFQDFSNLMSPPYALYWEENVDADFYIQAPLPEYNDSYDVHCDALDPEGEPVYSISTARLIAISACIIKLKTDIQICKNSFPGNGPFFWACMGDAGVAQAACLILAAQIPL